MVKAFASYHSYTNKASAFAGLSTGVSIDHDVSFRLNGDAAFARVDGRRTLLDLLRGEMALRGPKYGCGKAQCGACTVLVDGLPARSCILRAARIGGTEVTTIEGLAWSGRLHPVQRGFVEKNGAQCGYCLNGMIMSAVALLAREPRPDRARIRQALKDNLCRCGAHMEILDAVARAAELMAEEEAGADE